ncbi:MAG TPA: tRNA (adenosine(37)-N6)-threonylcarbamoyltransferase complex dimerization subunit type 1 TsaB, partial [Acidimicrobiales bacterium]|nr:tRNA (adenosine(37)-N6)-threonylcarbamoyltransferase complex dimerization subunit type 1 TsaB [Acidimicrobiales bacterium]
RHAETLAPQIEALCRLADVPLAKVGAIAVDVGPGLFTGLRVGFTTAKTLASALEVPMIGFTSLDLLAHAAHLTDRLVVAAVDARRGEVFAALYRPVPGGVQQEAPPAVVRPDELASELQARNEECLLVGDGAVRHRDVFADVDHARLGGPELAHPSAAVLVGLAHPRALREEFVAPHELAPLYLREPDAQRHGWPRA